MRASGVATHKKSVFATHGYGGAANDQLASEQISLPAPRQHGADDLDRSSGLQSLLSLFAHVRSEVGIDLTLRAG
jgi:hypothetical protein